MYLVFKWNKISSFKVKEINLVLNHKDRSVYYKSRIQDLYPTVHVVIGNRNNLFDYDSIIEKYIGDQVEFYLNKEEQIKLKKEFVNLKLI